MTTFLGFNTQDQFKKFTLVDYNLIKRDLLNAFNIRQGQLPGRPGYGTILWDYMFESQYKTTQQSIINEVKRVASGDPRLFVSDIQCYPQENGFLLSLEVQVVPSTDVRRLEVFFDQTQRTANYV
jgi:phage baseplate assembly protein W